MLSNTATPSAIFNVPVDTYDIAQAFLRYSPPAAAHFAHMFGMETTNYIRDIKSSNTLQYSDSRGVVGGSNPMYYIVRERDTGELGYLNQQNNTFQGNTPQKVSEIDISENVICSWIDTVGGNIKYAPSAAHNDYSFEASAKLALDDVISAYLKTVPKVLFKGFYNSVFLEGANLTGPFKMPDGILIDASANGLVRGTLTAIDKAIAERPFRNTNPADLVIAADAINFHTLRDSYQSVVAGLASSEEYYGFNTSDSTWEFAGDIKYFNNPKTPYFRVIRDNATGIRVILIPEIYNYLYSGSSTSTVDAAKDKVLLPCVNINTTKFIANEMKIADIGAPNIMQRSTVMIANPFSPMGRTSAPYIFSMDKVQNINGDYLGTAEVRASGLLGVVQAGRSIRIDIIGKTTNPTKNPILVDYTGTVITA